MKCEINITLGIGKPASFTVQNEDSFTTDIMHKCFFVFLIHNSQLHRNELLSIYSIMQYEATTLLAYAIRLACSSKNNPSFKCSLHCLQSTVKSHLKTNNTLLIVPTHPDNVHSDKALEGFVGQPSKHQ